MFFSTRRRRPLLVATATSVTAAAATALLTLGVAAATASTTATTPDTQAGWRASVGPGWVVDATSSSTTTAPGRRGPFTIAMISPVGVRHVVATTSLDVKIVDVSPDGKRALALRNLPDFSSRVLEFDLATGTSHVVSSRSVVWAQYSRPSAADVLLPDSDNLAVTRVGLDGRVLTRYRIGSLSYVVPSVNGKSIVSQSSSSRGLTVYDVTNARPVRKVADPIGYRSCIPAGTWDATQVTLQCPKTGTSAYDVARVSTTTGALQLLTHSGTASGDGQFGYDRAWKIGSSVLAQRSTGCGPGPLGLLDAAGHIGTELTWPATWAAPQVQGVTGTSVVSSSASCFNDAPTTELAIQDVVTHATVTLDSAAHLSAAVVAHE